MRLYTVTIDHKRHTLRLPEADVQALIRACEGADCVCPLCHKYGSALSIPGGATFVNVKACKQCSVGKRFPPDGRLAHGVLACVALRNALAGDRGDHLRPSYFKRLAAGKRVTSKPAPKRERRK